MKARGTGRGRLSRSAEFERVYRQGRSTANRHLVLYSFPNPSASEQPRLGLSVSRKVGGAVERNRIKRLLREAFARHEERLGTGHDIVVVARPATAELAEREGLEGLDQALCELIAKAGLHEEEPSGVAEDPLELGPVRAEGMQGTQPEQAEPQGPPPK